MGDATPTSNRDLSSRSAVPEAGQFGADTPADVGDAGSMYDNVVGGSDRLVSGTGSADYMWGDAVYKDAATVGGLDVFVFAPNNGQDVMYDLEQGKDHIDLTAIKELDFAHLGISYLDGTYSDDNVSGQDAAVIDLGGGNAITAVGFDASHPLTSNDFFF